MPRKIHRVIYVALVLAAVALAACGGGSGSSTATPAATGTAAQAGGFPAQLQRSDGKTVTLERAPQRLVSLSPGGTEIIYALGAEAELAAVDKDADYPQAAKDFPTKRPGPFFTRRPSYRSSFAILPVRRSKWSPKGKLCQGELSSSAHPGERRKRVS